MVNPIAASSAAAIIAGTRASTVASHSATPASTKDSAVSFTIFGQEGTMLVSCSMSNAQPASTNRPTNSATKAANCAKYRLGSALSGLPMANQTTPMPAVPQLDGAGLESLVLPASVREFIEIRNYVFPDSQVSTPKRVVAPASTTDSPAHRLRTRQAMPERCRVVHRRARRKPSWLAKMASPLS